MEAKKVTLKSENGKKFAVDEAVAMEFGMVKMAMEIEMVKPGLQQSMAISIGTDTNTSEMQSLEIPIHQLSATTLEKLIEYCEYHVKARAEGVDTAVEKWDREFAAALAGDTPTLCTVANASAYLDIKPLFDLSCRTIAHIITTSSIEQIRQLFNIENDFTPEEEEEIRRENAWAFQ